MSNYKFLIRFYLLEFLKKSISRVEKYGEHFSGDDTQVKKNREVINKLDEIFALLSDQVVKMLHLKFVAELDITEVTKQKELPYSTVQRLCSEPIKQVKKLAEAYDKK